MENTKLNKEKAVEILKKHSEKLKLNEDDLAKVTGGEDYDLDDGLLAELLRQMIQSSLKCSECGGQIYWGSEGENSKFTCLKCGHTEVYIIPGIKPRSLSLLG